MNPLFDICIPTCNSNPDFLKKAMNSALAQTETRWMMYVHDDGSNVDVGAIVRPYLQDERIRWYPNHKKLGIGGNWNASMKPGNAPYVAFLFQDDWWEPWYLERALKALEENPMVGMVSLEHEYVCDKGAASIPLYKDLERYRHEQLRPGFNNGMDMLRFWLSRELHPNIIGEPDFVVYRRCVMEKVGPFLEDMPQNLDMEYSLRCLMASDWYYMSKNCGYFRVHDDATSAVNQREGKGVFDRFRCFETVISRLPPGNDRKLATYARSAALTDMARKFLKRRKSGGQVNTTGAGGGAFKKFMMKHPLLVSKALITAYFSKET